MGVLSAILVSLGYVMGGYDGAALFLLLAAAMNFYTYFRSDQLAIKMTRSQPAPPQQYPELHSAVRRLAQRAGLPVPQVYITPSSQCNAFATGRNPQHAAIAVTDGLLRTLSAQELEGVLAHEMAHILNRDTLISTIAATMAGAISMLANILHWLPFFGSSDDDGGNFFGILVMAILAPIAALIVQMTISRSREYHADATGAKLTGHPNALANALLRLEQSARQTPMNAAAVSSAAHMFIVKPFRGGMAELFSTHPPINKRVERLRNMQL
jgi:heat shock protein HtpX